MRNLKKVLSLALALVMLLGMMVVGAGAATEFKDASSIPENRAVAVAVANALEVLLGDENGNFNPDKTLTRAEAAVVLTKLDLGASAANALTATNAASFDDVGTGYGWAKAYIDYCAGNGYMVGVGGNRFAPGRTLTSVEFATMVSRVLGYKDENEYGKDGWTAVKAAALARKAGLGADVAVANTDMSRADMAQMVLNALTAPMVEYTGLNGSIGDATFNSPATTRKHANDQGTNRADYKGDPIVPNITPIRLCEEKFPTLKLSTTEGDDFARTYSVWKLKNIEINGSTTKNEPDLAFNTKVTRNTVTDWGKLSNLVAGRNGVSLFINGEDCTEEFDAFDVGTGSDKVSYSIANMRPWIGYFTGAGREVEVYLNPDDLTDVEKVVVVDTALAEVTKENSDETISLKLMASQATDGNRVLSTKVGYGDVKKGDLVLVQGYGTRIIGKDTVITSVQEAPIVTGFARVKNWSSATSAASIVMDNETYYDAYSVMSGYDVQNFKLNDEFDSTLYLDTHGNIMKAVMGKDPRAVEDSLIAVKDFYKTLTNGKIVTMVTGVISNGDTVTWPCASDYTLNTAQRIYTYTDGANGYTLIPVTSSDASDGRFGASKSQYLTAQTSSSETFKSDDVYAKGSASAKLYSDTVKFIFVNSDGVTVLNGRQNFTFNGTAGAFYAQAQKDNEITAVFITAQPNVVDISDIIYVHSRYRVWDEVYTDANGKNTIYYGYKAYTSTGEEIDHFLGEKENMAGKFIVANKNDDGAYKLYTPTVLDSHTKVDGKVMTANGLSGDAFIMNPAKGGAAIKFIGRSSAKVVDLSGEKYYIDSIAELNRCVNDGNTVTVCVIYNEANSTENVQEAKTVYVIGIKKGITDAPTGETGADVNVIAKLDDDHKLASFVATGTDDLSMDQKASAIKAAYVAAHTYATTENTEVKYELSLVASDYVYNVYVGGKVYAFYVDGGVTKTAALPTETQMWNDTAPTGLPGDRNVGEWRPLVESGYLSTTAKFTPTGTQDGVRENVTVTGIQWNTDFDVYVPGFFCVIDDTPQMTIREAYHIQSNNVLWGSDKDEADADKGTQKVDAFGIVPVLKEDGNTTFYILFRGEDGKMYSASTGAEIVGKVTTANTVLQFTVD